MLIRKIKDAVLAGTGFLAVVAMVALGSSAHADITTLTADIDAQFGDFVVDSDTSSTSGAFDWVGTGGSGSTTVTFGFSEAVGEGGNGIGPEAGDDNNELDPADNPLTVTTSVDMLPVCTTGAATFTGLTLTGVDFGDLDAGTTDFEYIFFDDGTDSTYFVDNGVTATMITDAIAAGAFPAGTLATDVTVLDNTNGADGTVNGLGAFDISSFTLSFGVTGTTDGLDEHAGIQDLQFTASATCPCVVPEPSGLILLTLAGFAGLVRRKRRG